MACRVYKAKEFRVWGFMGFGVYGVQVAEVLCTDFHTINLSDYSI